MMTLDRRGEGRDPGDLAGRRRAGALAAPHRTGPWPKSWNGVLPANTVGGDVTPFLSLK